MTRPLARLAARLFDRPHAIAAEKLHVIVQAVGPRLLGGEVDASFLDGFDRREPEPYALSEQGIAVLEVADTLFNRASGMDPISGRTSYEALRMDLRRAMASEAVRGILLRIDSPGGEASGCFDLVDEMIAMRGQKPIWACADDMACSGAYALAAGASRFAVTRTSDVGSIGVFAVHVDMTAFDQRQGLKYDFIHAGAHKVDLSQHRVLSDEARAWMQADVDRVYGLFVDTVAKGRSGMLPEQIRKTEGRVMNGPQAVAGGFADAVSTFEDVLAEMTAHVTRSRAGRMSPRPSSTSQRTERSMTTNTQENPEEGGRNVQEPAGATIIDLDRAREEGQSQGRQAALAYVREVSELCALAGLPGMANGFIAANKSIEDVRKALIDAQATAGDRASVSGAHRGDQRPGSDAAAGWKTAFARATGWRERRN